MVPITNYVKQIYETVNDEYDILLMKFDSNILFPLRVMYRRRKREIWIGVEVFMYLLVVLTIWFVVKLTTTR